MKFAYTILYVPEVPRTLAFYEAAFGFARRFLDESGQYGELDTGGTTLSFASLELARLNLPGGVEEGGLERRPAAFEIAFATDEVAVAYERAVAAGATAVAPPKVKPWGQTVAYVRDPDGAVIEICTPMG